MTASAGPQHKKRHQLQVVSRPIDRALLFDSLLEKEARAEGRLIAVVSAAENPVYELCVNGGALSEKRLRILEIEPLMEDGLPVTDICKRLSDRIREVVNEKRHFDVGSTSLFVHVDTVLGRCTGSDDAMRLFALCASLCAEENCDVFESVSWTALPRGLGAPFWQLHDGWIIHRNHLPGARNGLERAVHLSILERADFREQLVTLARQAACTPDSMMPFVLAGYRRGFLFVDQDYLIRYASGKAADLLGRNVQDVLGHPLSLCLDGVDYATLKREINRVDRGERPTPFITSWRLAPGEYQPREVSVDRIRLGSRTSGYLLSLSVSEEARGPRTVYNEAREDATISDLSNEVDVIHLDGSIDELESTRVTRREHEVLLLILRGMSNKEISQHLNIAEVTVKKHLTSIYRKLRVSSRRKLFQSFNVPNVQNLTGGDHVE